MCLLLQIMKKIILCSGIVFSIPVFSQVGINTSNPTNTLDVNGTTRVRNLGTLTSSTVSALFADENGVLGKANMAPQSQIAFYAFKNDMPYTAASYNAGTDQVVQIQNSQMVLNTIGTTVPSTGNVRISQSGVYMISGSISPTLGINNMGTDMLIWLLI